MFDSNFFSADFLKTYLNNLESSGVGGRRAKIAYNKIGT